MSDSINSNVSVAADVDMPLAADNSAALLSTENTATSLSAENPAGSLTDDSTAENMINHISHTIDNITNSTTGLIFENPNKSTDTSPSQSVEIPTTSTAENVLSNSERNFTQLRPVLRSQVDFLKNTFAMPLGANSGCLRYLTAHHLHLVATSPFHHTSDQLQLPAGTETDNYPWAPEDVFFELVAGNHRITAFEELAKERGYERSNCFWIAKVYGPVLLQPEYNSLRISWINYLNIPVNPRPHTVIEQWFTFVAFKEAKKTEAVRQQRLDVEVDLLHIIVKPHLRLAFESIYNWPSLFEACTSLFQLAPCFSSKVLQQFFIIITDKRNFWFWTDMLKEAYAWWSQFANQEPQLLSVKTFFAESAFEKYLKHGYLLKGFTARESLYRTLWHVSSGDAHGFKNVMDRVKRPDSALSLRSIVQQEWSWSKDQFPLPALFGVQKSKSGSADGLKAHSDQMFILMQQILNLLTTSEENQNTFQGTIHLRANGLRFNLTDTQEGLLRLVYYRESIASGSNVYIPPTPDSQLDYDKVFKYTDVWFDKFVHHLYEFKKDLLDLFLTV
ncbi:hypothetical protein AcV7_002398 [Taiwanofungus camphoratus]|nr:hypothetical protein AcV7_002398 [Antrodia cinnamomea]